MQTEAKSKEIREQFNKLITSLDSAIKNENFKNCMFYVNAGFLINKDEFFKLIKKDKILVSSKYEFNHSKLLMKIIDEILKMQSDIERFKDYFLSIKNLNMFSEHILFIKKEIEQAINQKGVMLFLRLGLKIDYIFMSQYFIIDDIKSDLFLSDTLQKYIKEDLTSALSYISYIYHNNCKPSVKQNYEQITDKEIDKLILYGIKIKKIHEIDLQIHAFEYRLVLNEKNEYILLPPNEYFKKSITLGYCFNEMSRIGSNSTSSYIKEAMLIKDIARECYKNKKDNFLIETEKNYKRWIFRIQPEVISMCLKLNENELFPHEAIIIEYYSKELMIDANTLLEYNIDVGVSFYDLIIFKRYIEFLRWIAYFCIQEYPHINNHSLLSLTFDSNSYQHLFPFFDTEKLNNILKLVSFDFSLNDSVFDMQYQPICKGKYGYLTFINIFSESNLIRNSLQLTRKRFFENGKIDPLVDLLEKTFKDKNIDVKKNMKYGWGNQNGEIDIIAVTENFVFAFECKNSLLPCNSYEERTSYDYLIKASEQLSKFKNYFVDLKFQEYLEKKLGYCIKDKTLITSIIMSNRMFLGYRIDGHSVRGSYEICNFIKTGNITMMQEKKCFWQGSELTESDLYDFLEKDMLHSKLFDSFEEETHKISFGKNSITETKYVLNLEKVAKSNNFNETLKDIQDIRKTSTA